MLKVGRPGNFHVIVVFETTAPATLGAIHLCNNKETPDTQQAATATAAHNRQQPQPWIPQYTTGSNRNHGFRSTQQAATATMDSAAHNRQQYSIKTKKANR
jgi:hypothetical protein